MDVNPINAVWQTLKCSKPKTRERNKFWGVIKILIRLSIIIWKLLKLFSDDGDDS